MKWQPCFLMVGLVFAVGACSEMAGKDTGPTLIYLGAKR
jgi:hypothetical protein